MGRYHVSKSGKVTPCFAKKDCPLGTAVAGAEAKDKLERFNENKFSEEGKLEHYIETNRNYTIDEAVERGAYVNNSVSLQINNGQTTENLHRDPKTGDYTKERKQMHQAILNELHEKFENVPSERKVMFSAGLPGAGKTTVLRLLKEEHPDLDMANYAFVSSDDIKEELAKRDMIPKVEGLSPMEASTLAHSESSYLADRFLGELSSKGKNVIYDFTCKSFDTTSKRMRLLSGDDYSEKDMQFVFVDIPIEVAEKRTLSRYAAGLNDVVKNKGKSIGGRYLPRDVLYQNQSNTGNHSSKNAEALIAVYEVFKYKGLPTPIVYDNSRDTSQDPNARPIKIDFFKFKKK